MPKKPPVESIKSPSEFLDGLYVPEFIPDELSINRFIIDPDAEQQRASKSIELKTDNYEPGLTAPLTSQEADLVDAKIEQLLTELEESKSRINRLRGQIDEQVEQYGGDQELSFQVDISNNRKLRRAIRQTFGVKTDTITYSMYKAALASKRRIEKEETDAYVKGEF